MKFEKRESEYISGTELLGMTGVTFKILTEVTEVNTNGFGMKPQCSVQVSIKGITTQRKWTLNQQNVNFLISHYGEESNMWIDKTFGIYTENIKGNNTIRITA